MACDPGSIARHMRLYDQASRLAKVGAWEFDLTTGELTWTDGVYELFELASGSLVKRDATAALYADESRQRMEFMRAEVIRGGGRFTLDAEIRTYRGERRWMRLSAEVAYENGRAVRIFGAKQDVTSQTEALARLKQLAECDALTGLANRGVFDARYRDAVRGDLTASPIAGLALIDLDHFKAINDRLGHAAGDECLREAAARLRRVFSDAVLVSRIGGDEFAVLLRAPLGRLRIAHLCERALKALEQPVLWHGHRVDIGASIGVAIIDRPHVRKASDLFAEADCALYAAKDSGRNVVRIFGEEAGDGLASALPDLWGTRVFRYG